MAALNRRHSHRGGRPGRPGPPVGHHVGIAQDGQQPRNDQGHDRGARADPSDERQRDQEAEEGEAGDRLHDAGGGEHDARQPRSSGEDEAEGLPDRHRGRGGRQHEDDVLRDQQPQLGAALGGETQQIHQMADVVTARRTSGT